LVKIVNVTDGGNNLYIDDIYLGDGSDPINAVREIQSNLNQVILYPNPSNSFSTLQYSLSESTYLSISIYDAMGRMAETFFEGDKKIGVHSQKIELKNKIPGIYFVSLKTFDDEKVIKFLITK